MSLIFPLKLYWNVPFIAHVFMSYLVGNGQIIFIIFFQFLINTRFDEIKQIIIENAWHSNVELSFLNVVIELSVDFSFLTLVLCCIIHLNYE